MKYTLEEVLAAKPDIIILDTAYYFIDSFALCKDIKTIGVNNTRVIMITGHLKSSDANDAKKAGADDFVVKTNSYDLLINALKT